MFLKIIKNTLILFFIFIIILIPVVIYIIKFDNSSYSGGRLKKSVIKKPALVEILNLNNPGDARYVYSDRSKDDLSIITVSVNSKKSHDSVGEWMDEIIYETIGKAVLMNEPRDIIYPKKELLADGDLNEIRRRLFAQTNAELYLIYAGTYAESPSSVGVVVHRDTIFIFRDAIEALSERGYVRDVLEKTTIMHEWGHLLGLDHFESEDCIMNEMVEVYDRFPLEKGIPTEYCWEELDEIKNLTN